jgi:cytochrome d ubiquinol oxidase subunit I
VNTLDLSRWQFGITTVYHFLFVPITIGMAFLVAGFEAAWLRTGHERWLKLTRFYGRLFLINFAMGVVTGIVQEFQFGMNWSEYSRFVGNIFGAPLAIEALLAFFLESTFLGLWVFGWDRLPARLHNACLWAVAVGTTLSAYFILVANSWMQHPVGYHYNAAKHLDELSSFAAVLVNPAQLAAFPHVMAGCFLTAGALVAGVAMWHLIRRPTQQDPQDVAAFRSAVKAGAITALAAAVVTIATGDIQGKLFTTRYQPMKMAAAEALYHTSRPAPLSLLTIGTLNGAKEIFTIGIPRLLSFLATGNWNARVQGIDNLQAHYSQVYGPGSYTPVIPVIYWSFRLMIGVGLLTALIALIALAAIRRGRTPRSRVLLWAVAVMPLLPLAANSFGWVMTEMGRQPWLVYGQLKTVTGVSPNSAGEVLASMIVLTLLYGALAVIEAGLLLRYIKAGLAAEPEGGEAGGETETTSLVY